MSLGKTSLTWTLFLLVLLTTQIRDSDAGADLKLKKLLKKVLLLRALSPKKSLTVVPIPIPLSLLKKLELELPMPMMPKMPEPMPYPMYMPKMPNDMMTPKGEMKMPSSMYPVMGMPY